MNTFKIILILTVSIIASSVLWGNDASVTFLDGILGRVGNWRSGLGLAYPHFHEDVSVSVPFV